MNKNFYYSLGRPFSPLYSMVMTIRERCYCRGILKSAALDVPVISIGNLTMGGTGKTPLVRYLAALLQEQGLQPSIISRGYGGATRERVNIVSDGKEVLLDASYVGDEPRMLAESLPGVFVLTGIVRKLPAAQAVAMGADVLLLDDGFQHLALRRDLDLVLFNSDELAGNSRVFPGGDLREPVKALHRCDAFIMTGTTEQNRERANKFADLLREKFPGKPVIFSSNRVSGFVQQQADGTRVTVQQAELDNNYCFAFCGIGRPDGFRQTIAGLGLEPVAFMALADHHAYQKKIIKQLRSEAEKAGAACFLCTEKDLVKLQGFDLGLPLYAICMEAVPDPDLAEFIAGKGLFSRG
jgi:tetraacyldisaccharide 4'-kinase